jgi:hypothetical protein
MKSFTTNPAKDGLGIRFQKMVFRDNNMVVVDMKNNILATGEQTSSWRLRQPREKDIHRSRLLPPDECQRL